MGMLVGRRASCAGYVVLWLCLLWLSGLHRCCEAVEIWMPQIGEVELERLPRGTPEEKFRHACALIGMGRYRSGIKGLRGLLKKAPEGGMAEQSRFMIAFAYLHRGKHKRAFKEAGKFLDRYPESSLASRAAEMQLRAVRELTRDSLRGGIKLYDRLIARQTSKELVALCLKEKADALLANGEYSEARYEYELLTERYPQSVWLPHCYFKMAECEFEVARWLGLGGEHLGVAIAELSDSLAVFPEHSEADKARERLREALSMEAARLKGIAQFYIKARKRPHAAVNYLDLLVNEFPGSEEARWAADTLENIRSEQETPLRGDYREQELPGVETKG